MKRAAHTYSDSARRDLEEIRGYLKVKAGSVVAGRVGVKLRNAVAKICDFPSAGVSRPEFQPDCRFARADPYVVYYAFDGQRVLVLRIVHHARDRDTIMGG